LSGQRIGCQHTKCPGHVAVVRLRTMVNHLQGTLRPKACYQPLFEIVFVGENETVFPSALPARQFQR
jgi:hypothetical protein